MTIFGKISTLRDFTHIVSIKDWWFYWDVTTAMVSWKADFKSCRRKNQKKPTIPGLRLFGCKLWGVVRSPLSPLIKALAVGRRHSNAHRRRRVRPEIEMWKRDDVDQKCEKHWAKPCVCRHLRWTPPGVHTIMECSQHKTVKHSKPRHSEPHPAIVFRLRVVVVFQTFYNDQLHIKTKHHSADFQECVFLGTRLE